MSAPAAIVLDAQLVTELVDPTGEARRVFTLAGGDLAEHGADVVAGRHVDPGTEVLVGFRLRERYCVE